MEFRTRLFSAFSLDWPRTFGRAISLVTTNKSNNKEENSHEETTSFRGDGHDRSGTWFFNVSVWADNNIFSMVRSSTAVAADCLANAKGRVTISPLGPVENMHVEVSGLPPNAGFDLFVIQLPDKPFGLSWYQGDIHTDSKGTGVGDFTGRFSLETFIVAPGSGPAPVVHTKPPFPDASSNPATNQVHRFHLGLWFDSTEEATKAGCPNTETPFNGDHTAGVQAMSTRNFPALSGPLKKIP